MSRAHVDRFPSPWKAVEIDGGWQVLDANGIALGYFYGRDNATDRKAYPLTRDQARRMAVNFARSPELLALEKSERIFDEEHDRNSLKPAARKSGS
jgi:hypothetical protein